MNILLLLFLLLFLSIDSLVSASSATLSSAAASSSIDYKSSLSLTTGSHSTLWSHSIVYTSKALIELLQSNRHQSRHKHSVKLLQPNRRRWAAVSPSLPQDSTCIIDFIKPPNLSRSTTWPRQLCHLNQHKSNMPQSPTSVQILQCCRLQSSHLFVL